MHSSYKKVDFSKIDLADASFRITAGDASAELITSIDSIGLLNPPTLLPKDENYCVVCGFARAQACHQLGFKEVIARVLSPDTSLKACVQLAVSEKAFQQNLNPVEQAHALEMLTQVYDSTEALIAESQYMGLVLNLKLVDKLILVQQMPSGLKTALATGAIALPVAIQLNSIIESGVLDALCDLFVDLNLSLNRQRALLDSILAISKREQVGIQHLLDDSPLENIRQDQDLDRRQRATQIQRYLKKRRWPSISSFERNYAALIKMLDLKKGTRLVAPANFEGRTYSLQFDFHTLKEMKAMEQEVRRIVQSPHMARILDQLKPKA